MLPLERNVLQYCLKYGYMNFCTALDMDEKEVAVNVIDYVADELGADNMEFSVGIYARIFNILLEMKDEFRTRLDARILDIEKELAEKEKAELERIAERELDMSGIKREEERLNRELSLLKQDLVSQFSREYPAREMASHEDPEIRRIVIELIKEKHQLSHIFTKDNKSEETLEQKLSVLLPRAMIEWKNEIIGLSLAKLIKSIEEASLKGDIELVMRLQQEMLALTKLRSEMARNIGDRILSPN